MQNIPSVFKSNTTQSLYHSTPPKSEEEHDFCKTCVQCNSLGRVGVWHVLLLHPLFLSSDQDRNCALTKGGKARPAESLGEVKISSTAGQWVLLTSFSTLHLRQAHMDRLECQTLKLIDGWDAQHFTWLFLLHNSSSWALGTWSKWLLCDSPPWGLFSEGGSCVYAFQLMFLDVSIWWQEVRSCSLSASTLL